jgi:hypothetical protein
MHPIRFPNILINFGMYNDIPIVHDIPKWYFHGGFANSWVKKTKVHHETVRVGMALLSLPSLEDEAPEAPADPWKRIEKMMPSCHLT